MRNNNAGAKQLPVFLRFPFPGQLNQWSTMPVQFSITSMFLIFLTYKHYLQFGILNVPSNAGE